MQLSGRYQKRPVFTSPGLPRKSWIYRFFNAALNIVQIIWLPALIFLVPLLAYWPVLQSGFVSDDFYYHASFTWTFKDFIEHLAQIHGGEIQFPFFRPVAIASFHLDYMLWGADAFGFHFTNLILHSISCVLLYNLMIALGLNRFGAAAASMFFGLYPANPEAVTWVSGRFDLLAMVFIMVAFLSWCMARLKSETRWMLLTLASFLLAVLSKENAIAGVLLLPVLDWLLNLRTRREWGTGVGWHWKWYIIFIGLVVCIIGFRTWLFPGVGGYFSGHGSAFFSLQLTDLWNRLIIADLWMLVTPVSRILWPEWLPGWHLAYWIAGGFLAVILTGMLIRSLLVYKRTDEAPFARIALGITWIIVLLLPTATIDGVKESLDFSRFLYLPVAGLSLWIGVCADAGWRSGKIMRAAMIPVLAAILFISGHALREHNNTWIEAGKISHQIHAAMAANTSQLPDDSTIFMMNFPWLWSGAHCAPIKYEGYIEYRFGKTGVSTQVVTMEPGEIDGWWEDITANWDRPGVGFVWDREAQIIKVLPQYKPAATEVENPVEFLERDDTDARSDGQLDEQLGPDITDQNSVNDEIIIPEIDIFPD